MSGKEFSINILGYGFVGCGMGSLCVKNNLAYNVYDIQEKHGNFVFFQELSHIVGYSETNSDLNYYVIALPTPSGLDGECDTTIVESTLKELSLLVTKQTYVIIKSTLVPGTCKIFNEQFPNLNIVLCPEFLREKSYQADVINAKYILLGIPQSFDMVHYQNILKVMRLFYKHNLQIDIYMKDYGECELFKYTVNNFLAVKVWYFNKIYDVSESLGIDYQIFRDLFTLDPRIAGYGTTVPGDHGRGFAGSCLIKEQNGFIKLLEKLQIDSSVIKAISAENAVMRD